MQTEWLYSFVETVHMKSLTKAGEKLNLSQTALSKQIKNLEDAFGTSLFNRSTAGMDLTPEGRLLYDKVQVWLKDFEEVKRQLANLKSTNHVVIGCLPSIATYYLPSMVIPLKSDGIRVDIRVLPTSEDVRDAFVSGDVDVGIMDRVITLPKIYPTADLFTEPYYAIVPESNPLSLRTSIDVATILNEKFVLHPRCDVRQKLDEANLGVTVLQEIAHGATILGFVSAGAGVTIAPETEARNLSQPNLVPIPITNLSFSRTIYWAAKSAEQFHFLTPYFRRRK